MAAFKPVTAPACCSAVALSISMTGSAALADVTAAQIWSDWQTYMESSGYAVTAQESQSGDTLSVSDITMTIDIPEEDGTVTLTLSEMAFEENGDGTVSIRVPQTLPMTVNVDAPDAEDVQVVLNYLSSGLDMRASGDPDDITYNYTADELGFVLDQVVVEDEAVDPGTVEVTFTAVEGTSRMQVGDLRSSEQAFAAGTMSYVVDVIDPEGEEGRVMMNGQAQGFGFEANGTMPLDMDGADMATAIQNGFMAEGLMAYESGSTEFRFEDPEQTIEGSSSSDSGDFAVALGADGLSYALGAAGVSTTMSGGDFPFPIEYAMQEIGLNMTIPVAESEEVQDFALGLRLTDFTMSELLWSLFDPEGQLPRDPATIDIDTTGSGTLAFNLLDPEAMEAVEDGEEAPGELNAINLNALILRAAGAELTGQGSFTFDNSDLQTFGGLPAPDGSVDLRLQGANGLLDTLIAMGYLPQDQAMGVRMMMGMFAVPGDGDDVLNSTIEVKPDGQILANGQRLR